MIKMQPFRIIRATALVVLHRVARYFRSIRFTLGDLQPLAFGVALVGGMAIYRFLSTETPAEAVLRNQPPLPPQCDAAYFVSYRGWSCWYTVSDHPFAFAATVAAVVPAAAIVAWCEWRAHHPKRGVA